MPTSLHELLEREVTAEDLAAATSECSYGGTRTIGGFKVLTETDMLNIYRQAR